MLIAALLLNGLQIVAQEIVDPTTLDHKIMAGYQGWFGASGDGSGYGWIHWSRSGATPDATNITFDMWPDLREYDADELFATNFVYSDLTNAGLYSAYTYKTVERHVKWMKEYGIDGVFVQRFISSALSRRDQRDTVLQNVRHASEKYGRVFANMYDMSGARATVVEDLKNDWIHLVDDLKITESPNYLHHNGLPVLSIWGFNVGGSVGTVTSAMASELVRWFTTDAPEKYRVTLKGGVNDNWRTQAPEWQAVYDQLDIISPWAVGRYNDEAGADQFRTYNIAPDLANTQERGIDYIPVIFPGFSWENLKGEKFNHIKRNGGKFFWRQMFNAIDAGCDMVYIAMYDEVDEGTAIYKVAENAGQTPTTGKFVTLDIDGYTLPSDWYLRLSGEGTRMLRGEIPLTSTIPIVPFPDSARFLSQEVPTIMVPGSTTSVHIMMENTGTTNWTATDSFRLGSPLAPGSDWWGTVPVELEPDEVIAPGETRDFFFEITAPASEGVYPFQFGMWRDSVGWFGEPSPLRLIRVADAVDFLDDCDALTGWEPSVRLELNGTDQKQGSNCITFTGGANDSVEFQKQFEPVFSSGITVHDAVLQFWYYISDASLNESGLEVELGSGGAQGTDTYSWTITGLSSGWNLLTLKVSDARVTGIPDLDAISWFNLSGSRTGDVTTRIDEIQIFDRYAGMVKFELVINNGSGGGNYVKDEIIQIKAEEAPAAQQFIGWVIDSGEPLIEHVNAPETSVRMPESNAEITASYKVMGIYLDDCDLLQDWGSSAALSLNTMDQKEGLGCIEFSGSSTDEYKKTFSSAYNSGASVETGRLQFWYYVSDASLMGTNNQVELGSAGRADQNEYNWNLSGLESGWNFISLNISDAGVTEGGADLSAINWFRIYNFKSGSVTTRIDAIEIVDPSAGDRYPLTIFNGTGDGNYYSGIEVTITAEPIPEGKMFDTWVINSGSPVIANSSLATTTLTMPEGEAIITATFTDIQQYSLTVNSGSGSGSYLPGENILIFAGTAPGGKIFDQWVVESGDPVLANAGAPLTYLTMPSGDVVVTATYVDEAVSIPAITDGDGQIRIYPNPASREVSVRLNLEWPSEVDLALHDLQGREVERVVQKMMLAPGQHVLSLPVSGIDNGIYLVKLTLGERIFTGRLVIQH